VTVCSPERGARQGETRRFPLDDRLLIEAHQAGDPAAFTEIVRQYYGQLYRQALRRLASREEAEDAVQETFLRAYRSLDRFGLDGSWRLGAWLGRILSNVCIDLARDRQRRLEQLNSASSRELVTKSPDPSEAVGDAVALAKIHDALTALPDSQRQAFELRALEELSYRDIASRLGISEDNARTRVQRARSSLRRALAGFAETGSAAIVGARHFFLRLRSWATNQTRPPGPISHASRSARTLHSGEALTRSTPTLPGCHLAQLGSASPAASGAIGAGSPGNQILLQLVTSPALQSAVGAVASAPTAKGSLVMGLAAGLATVSALVVPSHQVVAGSPHGQYPGVRPPAAEVASQSTAAQATGAKDPTTPPTASPGTSAIDPTGSQGTPARGSGPTSTSEESAVNAWNSATPLWLGGAPSWVALAALAHTPSNLLTSAASSAGGGPTTSDAASSESAGSAPPKQPNPAASTAALTAESPPATDATSGPNPASAPPGGPSGGSSTDEPSSTPRTSGTSTTLPPGSCSTVPGFTLGSSPAAVPPITSGQLAEWLQTDPANLTTVGTQPVFSTTGWFGTSGPSTGSGTQLLVDAGTCFHQQGALLVVDLTGPGGDVVQLVGNLLGADQSPGSSAPTSGQGLAGTFFFRGSAEQVGGTVVDGQNTLPWGLQPLFVAQLSLQEPANTAQLTIVFIDPASISSTEAPPTSTSSTGATAPPASP